ncbi:MAG: hypothetical protein EOP05_07685 [Proteobacteria bacterium]|nr:MAG: hypothetical protein EOP05_07685 [Pseudomonadota bacterium]
MKTPVAAAAFAILLSVGTASADMVEVNAISSSAICSLRAGKVGTACFELGSLAEQVSSSALQLSEVSAASMFCLVDGKSDALKNLVLKQLENVLAVRNVDAAKIQCD